MSSSAPSLVDLNANRGPTIVKSSIAVSVVSTTFVCMRLFARRLRHVKLGADDYSIIVACVSLLPPPPPVPILRTLLTRLRSWNGGTVPTVLSVSRLWLTTVA